MQGAPIHIPFGTRCLYRPPSLRGNGRPDHLFPGDEHGPIKPTVESGVRLQEPTFVGDASAPFRPCSFGRRSKSLYTDTRRRQSKSPPSRYPTPNSSYRGKISSVLPWIPDAIQHHHIEFNSAEKKISDLEIDKLLNSQAICSNKR